MQDLVQDGRAKAVLPDRLEAGEVILPLVRRLSFGEYERLDDRLDQQEIEGYCREFVASAIRAELAKEQDIAKEKDRIRALSFIMNEFLPFLVSKTYAGDDLVLDSIVEEEVKVMPVERAKKDIAQRLAKDFGMAHADVENPAEALRQVVLQREEKAETGKPLLDPVARMQDMGIREGEILPSLLGFLLSHQPLYVFQDQAYLLERGNGGDFTLSLRGRPYQPGHEPAFRLGDLSARLLDMKKRAWRIDALQRSKDAFEEIKGQLRQDAATTRQMHELAKLTEYDLGNCGFILKDGNYWVYSRIQKFATQDGRNGGEFWPFPSNRVAIHVGWQEGKPFTTGHALVIDPSAYHPCLYDRTSGFSNLCNLRERQCRNTVDDMVRKISDGVEVFTHPLNKESLDSHTGHTYFGTPLKDILCQGKLTREQAIEQGYLIKEVVATKVGRGA